MGKIVSSIFYKNKPIIGFDFSKIGARVMSLDASKMTVHGYGAIDFDPSSISDDLDISADYIVSRINELFEKNLIGKLNSNRAVLSLPTSRTFSRTFTVPKDQESSLRDAVNLEVEQYIPMPPDLLYVDHQIIKRDKESLTVLMCAAPKKDIETMTSIAKQCGIEIAMIEPSINAIARILRLTEGSDSPTVILDIGPTTTDIAMLDSIIRVTGGANVGGNTFTLDIAKKLSTPLEAAHQLKVLSGLNAGPKQEQIAAALQPSLQTITKETQKVLRYYADRFPSEAKMEQVLIVGSGSNVPGLGDYFTNELSIPSRTASPWQVLNFSSLQPPTKQLRTHLMTVAGLALVDPKEIWK